MFKLLVYGRILFPSSKLAIWRRGQGTLPEDMSFTDDDVYRSLAFFAGHKEALTDYLFHKTHPDKGTCPVLYYGVTNYYWEVDNEDCGSRDIPCLRKSE